MLQTQKIMKHFATADLKAIRIFVIRKMGTYNTHNIYEINWRIPRIRQLVTNLFNN